ncbi:MAG TPA: FAD binding domain-containing protein [Candidatus Eisenbacteria bacterium]|nr:FAD binding domain-containing protein [Candidatus Eisenbacteria bacterium]
MLTLPRFEWRQPGSVEEALSLLSDQPGEALLVAGGTDAVPNLKHRLHEPRRVVHLGRVEELRFLRETPEGLDLGPRVTLAELSEHPFVRRHHSSLAKAAGLVAGPQLRAMGTVGGNLCLDTRCTYYNQTHFWREALGFCLKKDGIHCHVVPQGKRCVAAHSSDVAPVLITLEATVEITGRSGSRVIPVEEFFVGDGIHNNVLRPDEMVTRIHVPARSRDLQVGYQKLRPRNAIDFPMLSVAFAARGNSRCESARLVVSALAAKPRSIGGLESLVMGHPLDAERREAIAQAAYKQCRPQTSVPYDADWRHEMVPVFVKRAMAEATGEARHG